MDTIDWLRPACAPAVRSDIGYETSPYEFFIGLSVWAAAALRAHSPGSSSSPGRRAGDAILQGSIIGSERLAVRPDFLSQIQFLFQVPRAYE